MQHVRVEREAGHAHVDTDAALRRRGVPVDVPAHRLERRAQCSNASPHAVFEIVGVGLLRVLRADRLHVHRAHLHADLERRLVQQSTLQVLDKQRSGVRLDAGRIQERTSCRTIGHARWRAGCRPRWDTPAERDLLQHKEVVVGVARTLRSDHALQRLRLGEAKRRARPVCPHVSPASVDSKDPHALVDAVLFHTLVRVAGARQEARVVLERATRCKAIERLQGCRRRVVDVAHLVALDALEAIVVRALRRLRVLRVVHECHRVPVGGRQNRVVGAVGVTLAAGLLLPVPRVNHDVRQLVRRFGCARTERRTLVCPEIFVGARRRVRQHRVRALCRRVPPQRGGVEDAEVGVRVAVRTARTAIRLVKAADHVR